MNNRGSIQDIVLIAVILLIFVITLFISLKLMNQFGDGVSNQVSTFEQGRTIVGEGTKTLAGFDNLFIYLTLGLGISVLAGAYFLKAPTLFVVIGIILLIFIVPILAIISNVSDDFVNDESFANETVSYPTIPKIMNELPLWGTLIGILALVLLYAKGRSDK